MSPRERFLLWMLSGIFLFQAGIFIQGFVYCSRAPELCTDVGIRYDKTFSAMTAGVMGLLAGNALPKQ